jgi:hypothetical protein
MTPHMHEKILKNAWRSNITAALLGNEDYNYEKRK